jgi:hypothetical protein
MQTEYTWTASSLTQLHNDAKQDADEIKNRARAQFVYDNWVRKRTKDFLIIISNYVEDGIASKLGPVLPEYYDILEKLFIVSLENSDIDRLMPTLTANLTMLDFGENATGVVCCIERIYNKFPEAVTAFVKEYAQTHAQEQDAQIYISLLALLYNLFIRIKEKKEIPTWYLQIVVDGFKNEHVNVQKAALRTYNEIPTLFTRFDREIASSVCHHIRTDINVDEYKKRMRLLVAIFNSRTIDSMVKQLVDVIIETHDSYKHTYAYEKHTIPLIQSIIHRFPMYCRTLCDTMFQFVLDRYNNDIKRCYADLLCYFLPVVDAQKHKTEIETLRDRCIQEGFRRDESADQVACLCMEHYFGPYDDIVSRLLENRKVQYGRSRFESSIAILLRINPMLALLQLDEVLYEATLSREQSKSTGLMEMIKMFVLLEVEEIEEYIPKMCLRLFPCLTARTYFMWKPEFSGSYEEFANLCYLADKFCNSQAVQATLPRQEYFEWFVSQTEKIYDANRIETLVALCNMASRDISSVIVNNKCVVISFLERLFSVDDLPVDCVQVCVPVIEALKLRNVDCSGEIVQKILAIHAN